MNGTWDSLFYTNYRLYICADLTNQDFSGREPFFTKKRKKAQNREFFAEEHRKRSSPHPGGPGNPEVKTVEEPGSWRTKRGRETGGSRMPRTVPAENRGSDSRETESGRQTQFRGSATRMTDASKRPVRTHVRLSADRRNRTLSPDGASRRDNLSFSRPDFCVAVCFVPVICVSAQIPDGSAENGRGGHGTGKTGHTASERG